MIIESYAIPDPRQPLVMILPLNASTILNPEDRFSSLYLEVVKMWFGHMGNVGFGGMLLGGIVMFVFWGGLITLTVIAVRAVWNSGSGSVRTSGKPDADPIEIAQQRYARGDISRDQFLEIKKDLEG